MRAQAAEGHGNAEIMRGNVNKVSGEVSKAEEGISKSKEHAAYRQEVTGQADEALTVSKEKQATVAADAPGYQDKADEGKELSLIHILLNAGVVEVVNRDAPRPEWMLRVAPPLWDAARDSLISAPGQYTLHAAADLAALEELILPDDFLQRLGHVPSLLAGGKARLLILRGMMGSERLEVAGACLLYTSRCV